MFYHKLEETAVAIRARNEARARIVHLACKGLGVQVNLNAILQVAAAGGNIVETSLWPVIKKEVDLRQLRPQDVFSSESTYSWCHTMSDSADTTIVNAAQNKSNRWYYINAVAHGEGVGELIRLKIKRAAQDAREWYVEMIHTWDENIGYVDDPVIVEEDQVITVTGYASTASTICDWGLLGEVAEKKGLLINP